MAKYFWYKHHQSILEVEAARQKAILKAIQAGLVQSAHDVSEGGVAVALSRENIRCKWS